MLSRLKLAWQILIHGPVAIPSAAEQYLLSKAQVYSALGKSPIGDALAILSEICMETVGENISSTSAIQNEMTLVSEISGRLKPGDFMFLLSAALNKYVNSQLPVTPRASLTTPPSTQ